MNKRIRDVGLALLAVAMVALAALVVINSGDAMVAIEAGPVVASRVDYLAKQDRKLLDNVAKLEQRMAKQGSRLAAIEADVELLLQTNYRRRKASMKASLLEARRVLP